MTEAEARIVENYVLSRRLEEISHPDNLRFLAYLIQDHDHMREKLMTEPNPRLRREKFEAMRPYLRFRPDSVDGYEIAERLRAQGFQPIYGEQEAVSKLVLPPSALHEVKE